MSESNKHTNLRLIDCTFYSYIRFPYSDSKTQHEYATQICKTILREHPEFKHTGPYPLGYHYCGDIPVW